MTRSALVALAGLALLLAGCRSPSANRIVIPARGEPALTVVNGGLQSEAEIMEESGRSLYEGEIMLGWVRVQSHVDAKRQYEYRWRFYDADGVGMGDRHWTVFFINAVDEVELQGRAPRPGAEKAELLLRYSNKETGHEE